MRPLFSATTPASTLVFALAIACGGCSPSKITGTTRTQLALEVRFPRTAESIFARTSAPARAAASIDTIVISVFASRPGASEALLVERVLGVGPNQTELIVSLVVPPAPRYRVRVAGFGQRQRVGRQEPTTFGLQFLGEAIVPASSSSPSAVIIDMIDVVPFPVLAAGAPVLQWSPIALAIRYRVRGEDANTRAVVFDSTVTGTTVVGPSSSLIYRVRSELSDLVSAFSEGAPIPQIPAPTLTTLNPDTVVAGTPTFKMATIGSNFVSGAVVNWNGNDLATQFVSAGLESATVTAGLLGTPGTASVRVRNPDGQVSGQRTFTILFPPPSVTGLTPASKVAGSPPFTLVVNGGGFRNGAIVTWNGADLSTKFVSASLESASVTAALIGTPGTATVRVRNPDGQLSNSTTFAILFPAPTITSLDPDTVPAGRPPFKMAVLGSNFRSGGTAIWDGVVLPIQFVNANVESISVTTQMVATPGTASVNVRNPDGQISNTKTVTILSFALVRARPAPPPY